VPAVIDLNKMRSLFFNSAVVISINVMRILHFSRAEVANRRLDTFFAFSYLAATEEQTIGREVFRWYV
jgi:hypothetical protein